MDSGSSEDAGLDSPDGVMLPHDPARAMCGAYSGPEAAEIAGISYRQLDYWARRGWVVPSRAAEEGVRRRLYTAADIVRLAALGHLGRSRVDVATHAKATGRLRVSDAVAALVVWSIHDDSVRLVGAKELRRVASQPGRYVVFDPTGVLRRLGRRSADPSGPRPKRRTFTASYKLAVLSQYDRLTEPGAKGTLLRREGLHTSHLVAWRRAREAGDLRDRGRPVRRLGGERRAAALAFEEKAAHDRAARPGGAGDLPA
ncbi:MAG TPA: MerR family transcriptional regulator [Acidimicrobiales bacterium]|nr:MerR family transcriptional regulator [Acidimicrobiales bacterium]